MHKVWIILPQLPPKGPTTRGWMSSGEKLCSNISGTIDPKNRGNIRRNWRLLLRPAVWWWCYINPQMGTARQRWETEIDICLVHSLVQVFGKALVLWPLSHDGELDAHCPCVLIGRVACGHVLVLLDTVIWRAILCWCCNRVNHWTANSASNCVCNETNAQTWLGFLELLKVIKGNVNGNIWFFILIINYKIFSLPYLQYIKKKTQKSSPICFDYDKLSTESIIHMVDEQPLLMDRSALLRYVCANLLIYEPIRWQCSRRFSLTFAMRSSN